MLRAIVRLWQSISDESVERFQSIQRKLRLRLCGEWDIDGLDK